MDQTSTVWFLHLKGLHAIRIHHELEAVLRPNAMQDSRVTRALRSAIWAQPDSETPHSEIDDAIIQSLGGIPFAAVKKSARRQCWAPTPVHCHLTSPNHFILYPNIYNGCLTTWPLSEKFFGLRGQMKFFHSSSWSDTIIQFCL
jgi:hypothetical protein